MVPFQSSRLFFLIFILFKHASIYSFMGRYTHFFNLCYIQLCVKGAELSEGKFAICLVLILNSVLQVELLLVIPILVMS